IDDIDDPRGDIAGTVAAGRTRLAAALTLLGEADMPAIADDDELWHLLSGAGALSQTLAGRVEHAMLIARDVHGWSWRRIALALDAEPGRHASIRRTVIRLRRTLAAAGTYYDTAGRHTTTPAAATAVATYREQHPDRGGALFSPGRTDADGGWIRDTAEPSAVQVSWTDDDRTI